jgi:acyl-coenzyme A thioesterase PaaI-like protein
MALREIRTRKEIPRSVPDSEVQHFMNIPLAQPTLQDPNFKIYAMSRKLTHGGRGHTLMAGTFNTDNTIAHLLSFFRPPLETSNKDTFPLDPNTRAEVRRFYTFGSGLNAHPDLLHGGIIATVLDSTLGNVIGFAIPDVVDEAKGNMFTVQLNVRYQKPVVTPGTVMVRSWLKRVEEGGRKVWVEGCIEGENGVRHATGEGMWVSGIKKKKEEKL